MLNGSIGLVQRQVLCRLLFNTTIYRDIASSMFYMNEQ